MKKITSFIIFSFIMIMFLASCGSNANSTHVHMYGEKYNSNSSEHWNECECGEKNINNHYFGSWVVVKEATETEEGSRKRVCTICKYEKVEAIPALGHTHEYTSEIVKPTCETEGYTKHTCTCGDEYKDNIVQPLGHTEVIDEAVEATCENEGLTEGKHCSVCNKVLIKQEKVAATGHNYVSGVCSYCKCKKPSEGLEYELSSYNTYVVYSIGNCTDLDIIIPSTYNDIPVTGIGYSAFSSCSNLTNIEIPNSVTSIGRYAFFHCSSLTSIEIPKSVTSIGFGAFNDCSSLTSITLPSVGNELNGIDDTHFGYIFGATSYESNVVPTSLKEVIITGGTSIGDYAFYGCSSLTNLTIPKSISWIGKGAVSGCNGLENLYYQGTIEDWCDMRFYGTPMSYAKHIYMLDENNEYYEVKDITIPKSLTNISSDTFLNFKSLENVYYNGTIKDWCNMTFGNKYSNPMYYADHIYMLDENDEYYEAFEIEIPEGMTKINKHLFYGFDSVTKIIISESVTNIGESAFAGCSSLTNITIPNGVTSIGESTFAGCSSLTNITIPNGVTIIGDSTFEGCSSLTSIEIPNSVTIIGDSTFEGCSSLMNITIPNGVTSIGESAFVGCSSLTNLVIPESVTKITGGILTGCNSLESLEIPFLPAEKTFSNGFLGYLFGANFASQNVSYVPKSLKEVIITGKKNIDYEAFEGCGNIINISIPNVGAIEYSAFYECSSLESIIIPNVKFIGEAAFYGCYALKSITIPYVGCTLDGVENNHFGYIFGAKSYSENWWYVPKSLKEIIITGGTKIDSNAFYNCGGITSISIPNSVESIGESVFAECNSLESIIIPKSVTSIGENAFYNCSSLENVYYNGTIEDWANISIINEYSNPMKYANHFYLLDENNEYYEIKELVIPENITSIKYQFLDFDQVSKIVIPSSVISIGDSAFAGCSSLTSITIPNNVTSIGDSAFAGCSSLTSITIPNSVTSIGDSAFAGCSSLTSVTIPNGVTSIGDSTFTGCSSLTSITIPNSVTSIDSYAFYNCSSLTSIEIPNSVTSIGRYAFAECSSPTSITIPNSVTSIEFAAFKGCSNLESITIPFVGSTLDGTENTHFGYIFGAVDYYNYSCVPKSLKEVIITGGTTIPAYSFYYCSSLISVTIPESIEIIYGAFDGCYRLVEIYNLSSLWINKEIFRFTKVVHSSLDEESSLILTEDGYVFLYDETNYYLVDYKGRERNLTLPTDINGHPYIINTYAFYNHNNLKSIIIPNSVTSIEFAAFEGCSNLESITIPFVGAALNGTENTHFGYIFGAGSGTVNSSYVPESLKEVIITGGTTIAAYSFYYCSSLISVTIPESIEIIYGGAFDGCYRLVEIYNLSSLYINKETFKFTKVVHSSLDEESSLILTEDGYVFLYDETNYYLVDYKGRETNLTLPTDINGHPYIIYTYAFYNHNNLKSVIIPNSETSIEFAAFAGCSNLVSITIPFVGAALNGTENTHFGYIFGAGSGTINSSYVPTSLKKVIITGGTTIPAYSFYYCSSLISVTILNNVTSIGVHAFSGCSGLTNIEIPNSVTSIGESAFYNCSSLTSITIPNSVTSIEFAAFYNCSSLTSITIPNSVTSIEFAAFYNCSNLTNIEIPSSVTSIGMSTFEGCSSLTSITIPFVGATLNGTENTHFGYMFGAGSYLYNDKYIPENLKKVIITGGTSIGESAFYNCSNLTNIEIPSSVTSIGMSTFEGCSSLTSITLPFIGATLDGTSSTYFGYIFGASSYVYNDKYIPENLKKVIITGGTSIGESAFHLCGNLTSIKIPSSVTSIGMSTFEGCINLQYNIYDNGKYLGNEDNPYLVLVRAKSTNIATCDINSNTKVIVVDAFSDCSRLTSITVADDNTVYDSRENCNAIIETSTNTLIRGYQNTTIPNTVTSIGAYAFYNCSKLKSITIPNSVTSIGRSAFEGCSSLTSITIPNSVTSIGRAAFEGCSSLTSITIPDSVIGIGEDAFEGCSSLTSIKIPSSVTSIGRAAFYNCSSLTNIEILSSVTSIGVYAFYNCSSLTNIEIPSSVTSIGAYAFFQCSSLSSVFYKGTKEEWSDIEIESTNSILTSKIIYYYSEFEPTVEGNYWYYDDNLNPVIW